MSVQPLASAGNAKALRDAARVFEALNRPAAFSARQSDEFDRYLVTLARQYGEAGIRWSERSMAGRRHGDQLNP